jgi:hypothetical protein
MTKPKAIQWLEQETQQDIEYLPTLEPTGVDRHLSVRLPGDLAQRLERVAENEGLTVSQFIRTLIVAATQPLDPGGTVGLIKRIESDAKELRRCLSV